ncbi:MAG: hypothetical protein J6575_03445 [Bifidobacterium sp.]|nr:hypothetical protein [Bifidobacterium sp.]
MTVEDTTAPETDAPPAPSIPADGGNATEVWDPGEDGLPPDVPAEHPIPEPPVSGRPLADIIDDADTSTDEKIAALTQIIAGTSQSVGETSAQVSLMASSISLLTRYVMDRDGIKPTETDAIAATNGMATDTTSTSDDSSSNQNNTGTGTGILRDNTGNTNLVESGAA